jgi:hypothetical protein
MRGRAQQGTQFDRSATSQEEQFRDSLGLQQTQQDREGYGQLMDILTSTEGSDIYGSSSANQSKRNDWYDLRDKQVRGTMDDYLASLNMRKTPG